MSKNIGKWFEDQIHQALTTLQSQHGLYYHRLKDSHSAGRVIGNSPADFLAGFRGQAQLWEAKASEIHPSLRSCLAKAVDDGQVGHHRLWHLNGLNSWFIFYSDLIGEVEAWDGKAIVEAREFGAPLLKDGQSHRAPLNQLTDLLLDLFPQP